MKADAKKLEIVMGRRGASSKDITEISGIAQSTLLRAMKGNPITPATLGKIAKALDVDITEIMKEV